MAATLREVQMDSRKTPDGLLIQFQEFTWTPDGLHQDSWLSVTTSKLLSRGRSGMTLRMLRCKRPEVG
jgi:hypothetical protein